MDQHLHPIPADLADEAQSLWQSNAGVYRGSITGGEGLQAGLIGEVLVMEQLRRHGLSVERTGGPDNDLLVLGCCRIEVKTTRQAGTLVRPDYHAHVEDRSHRGLGQQACDAYVFCRVDYDHQHGAILGWDLPFNITGRKGRWALQRAGEVMGSGKPAPADNWVLPVSRLPSVILLPDYIRHWHKSAP